MFLSKTMTQTLKARRLCDVNFGRSNLLKPPIYLLSALMVIVFLHLQVPNQQVPTTLANAQQIGPAIEEVEQPIFEKSMDSLTVKENTPIGEVVYTLLAHIDGSSKLSLARILYGLEGTQLFNVDKTSGQVRVAQPIDREQTSDSVSFQVIATPYYMNGASSVPGPAARITVTVLILDENDNPPKVELVRVGRVVYDSHALARQSVAQGQQQQRAMTPVVRLNVSEDTPVGSVIVDLIAASDVDNASADPLRAFCIDCEPEFELSIQNPNSDLDQLNSTIVLINPLVHEPRKNVRLLRVTINDGKLNSTIMFEVTIDDIQNKPPQFVGSTTCIVKENVPIDTTLMTLQAVDGDALAFDELPLPTLAGSPTPGRQILYDFVSPSEEPNKMMSSSFAGLNNVLKLHPLTGQLQVANRLDRESYLNSSGVLALRVRARELTLAPQDVMSRRSDSFESILDAMQPFVDQALGASSEIDITVILVDVNDQEPHWLNASEIAELNMDQSASWYDSLPSDSDTGRVYKLNVRENSLAGSPITTRNEMFVYDLDNGDNAKFNLTLLDPFRLFDVEPKQVTGFALVTLKLLNNPQSSARRLGHHNQPGRLLDYENPNERSFIVQLIATETTTGERFTSKAQVQINVLDVNDNAPEFKEPAYVANVREDAPAGKNVLLVQAYDRDEISTQLQYSLHGRSAHLFDLNRNTGQLTVAECEPEQNDPTSSRQERQRRRVGRCLDYELQRTHNLMLEVSDGELTGKVPLTVFVDDANDNPPVFSLPIVDVVIEEGSERLEPPIKIEATDIDQSSVLSYSILEGNFEGLLAINNATGELQLTRPIRIAHDDYDGQQQMTGQLQLNKMTLIVEASDGLFTANGTVRIDVLDANDNAPKFLRSNYTFEVPESVAHGHVIGTVRAFDSDRGNNARITYRLQRGSYGQFEIDEATGELSVSHQASEFDSVERENYTLEVVAQDHGLVPKISSIPVYVHISDNVKRAPQFEPRIQRTDVVESTPNNTIIHKMQVVAAEVSSQQEIIEQSLIFEPGPILALDKNGQPVVGESEIERLESMFSVARDSGEIVVNSALDHDFASHINLTIYVSLRQKPTDITQMASQQSVGYLLINVLDDNTNAPIFGAPWTPMKPELEFKMQEELPVGSILTQLVAYDLESKISHYKIDPPNEYFELTSAHLGVIVNKKIIDYDTLMSQTFLKPRAFASSATGDGSTTTITSSVGNNIIQFNVYVYDSGQPQLSAKATVSVEVLPVNDWDCKFEQQVYEAHVKENSPAESAIVQVRAIDPDYGDQHNSTRYQLIGDHSELFNLDHRTGLLTVSNKGSVQLDRERLSQSVLALTVIGRDEQQPVVSTLATWPGSSNKRVARGASQTTSGRTCSATIKIHVDDVNDNPPLFSQRQYEVTAYDTDVVDVPLIKLIVRDDDTLAQRQQSSGQFPSSKTSSNWFKIISGNLNDSFNVTSSGLVYATKPLTAETFSGQPTILLRVQVRQQAASLTGTLDSFTDECEVRINLVRFNRFVPEWPKESLNKGITVAENAPLGTLVTQLRCTDRDLETSAINNFKFNKLDSLSSSTMKGQGATQSAIRYWIKSNGLNVLETNEFKLDSVSGNLTTKIELDRESQSFYQLVVACEDNGRPQSLENVIPLFVTVLDENDNKPEFLVPTGSAKSAQKKLSSMGGSGASTKHLATITFSVEEHQSKGLPVGEVRAIDRDSESQYPISYCLVEGNEFQEFTLDRATGILYTNQTLDRERQSSYDLLVKAVNDVSRCDELVQSLATKDLNSTAPISTNQAQLREKRGPNNERGNTEEVGDPSLLLIKIEVLDINDNAPVFRQPVLRAGVHHRSLINSLVTQVAAYDPDSGHNGTLEYKISEVLMYKTSSHSQSQTQQARNFQTSEQPLSKPIKLMQNPFRIDQQGNLYTTQLLTQYQLMSMFLLQLEAKEQSEPWRVARTKLEIYIYETSSQLKIRINLHPRVVETYRTELETLLSNATKYTAIINRARSYHGASPSMTESSSSLISQPARLGNNELRGQITTQTPHHPVKNHHTTISGANDEPTFSNIHLIFVDNFRIVNPNLVMEKFDLTSAQLFMPQIITQKQIGANNIGAQSFASTDSRSKLVQVNEISSLIDKIALASAVQSADYQGGSSSLTGIDWIESPSAVYVALTILLFIIGFIIFVFGCCCTGRIKDHIIKVAMDKLVAQQTLQAKINEQMLAATNQAALAATVGRGSNEYMIQQGGYMSSFDATKGCVINNQENMSILQRAMDSDYFEYPNYTTLNGHVNMGSHYYDTSELDGDGQQTVANGGSHYEIGASKVLNGSIERLDDSDEMNVGAVPKMIKKSKADGSTAMMMNNPSRQRQQVPPDDK